MSNKHALVVEGIKNLIFDIDYHLGGACNSKTDICVMGGNSAELLLVGRVQ